jgi:hypothetical protein
MKKSKRSSQIFIVNNSITQMDALMTPTKVKDFRSDDQLWFGVEQPPRDMKDSSGRIFVMPFRIIRWSAPFSFVPYGRETRSEVRCANRQISNR